MRNASLRAATLAAILCAGAGAAEPPVIHLRYGNIAVPETSAALLPNSPRKLVGIKELTPGLGLAFDLARIEVIHYLPIDSYLLWVPNEEAQRRLLELCDDPEYGIAWRMDAPASMFVPPEWGEGDGEFVIDVQLFAAGDAIQADLKTLEKEIATRMLSGPAQALGGRVRIATIATTRKRAARLDSLKTLLYASKARRPQLLGETTGLIVSGGLEQKGGKLLPSGDYLDWLRNVLGTVGEKGWFEDGVAFPTAVVIDNGVGSGDPANPNTPDLLSMADGSSRLLFNLRWDHRADKVLSTDAGAAKEGATNHGHMVASILAGAQVDRSAELSDPNGHRYGLGVNPFGRIGSLSLPGTPFLGPSLDPWWSPVDIVQAMDAAVIAVQNHASVRTPSVFIGNNSWGVLASPEVLGYDIYAQMYDAFAIDASPSRGGVQPMLSVCPAGNAGGLPGADNPNAPYHLGSVFSPAIAKNVIAVGGTENVDARRDVPLCPNLALLSFPDYGRNPFSTCDSAGDLWIASSRGSYDTFGATKPDIVAPAAIVSVNHYWPMEDEVPGCLTVAESKAPRHYSRNSGTSYAAPAVTAAAQLLAGVLHQRGIRQPPSPELLRAMILPPSESIKGGYTGLEIDKRNEYAPNTQQGFGMLRLDRVLDRDNRPIADGYTAVKDSMPMAFRARVIDADKPVIVTLAWSDPPAALCGPSSGYLVNDLDLLVRIEVNGEPQTVQGNMALEPRSAIAGESTGWGFNDRINTIERVALSGMKAGRIVEVRVLAHRLAQNVRTSVGLSTTAMPAQPFALATYNLEPIDE